MNVEKRIFIRQSQTELVTIVLEGPSLFSLCLPTPAATLSLPQDTMALLEAWRTFFSLHGVRSIRREDDCGDRPDLGCRRRTQKCGAEEPQSGVRFLQGW